MFQGIFFSVLELSLQLRRERCQSHKSSCQKCQLRFSEKTQSLSTTLWVGNWSSFHWFFFKALKIPLKNLYFALPVFLEEVNEILSMTFRLFLAYFTSQFYPQIVEESQVTISLHSHHGSHKLNGCTFSSCSKILLFFATTLKFVVSNFLNVTKHILLLWGPKRPKQKVPFLHCNQHTWVWTANGYNFHNGPDQ